MFSRFIERIKKFLTAELRDELAAVRDELTKVKADAAQVRQGVTVELEKAKASFAAVLRQEIARAKAEAVIIVRRELLAAPQAPASDTLTKRVARLEDLVISRVSSHVGSPEPLAVDRGGGNVVNLKTIEFGNRVNL